MKKQNHFEGEKFLLAYEEMTIECWYNSLNGHDTSKPPKEIYFLPSNEKELKDLISAFEKKYNKKLKYRTDGLTFISYEDTVL